MKGFISLCMIVKNEEKVIRRCLESVQGIVDEIIVVDTGSTDKTLEIVHEYTDKTYDFEWTNNFADARNYAQSKATSKWILVMDADEYVDRIDLEEAIEELKKNEHQHDAFNLHIYNFTGLSGENIIRHISVRLYKNQSDISYFRTIHEQVAKKDGELAIGFSNLILYHSGYLNKTLKEKNKKARNMALLEKEMKHSGQSAFDYFNLGNEFQTSGDYEKALESYIKAYQLKPDIRYSWVSFCVIQIINSLIYLERYTDGLSVIYDAEKVYNQSPDLKYLKALIYSLQYRFEDAKEELKYLLENANDFKGIIVGIHFLDYYPNKLMGDILHKQKHYQEAINYYNQALTYNKSSSSVLSPLFKIAVKYTNENEVIDFINQMNYVNRPDDFHIISKLLLNLPGGLTIIENYLERFDESRKLGFRLKKDLIECEYDNIFQVITSMDIRVLERVFNEGYFDFFDFLIVCLNANKTDFLSSVAKTFNELEGFVKILCGEQFDEPLEENYYLILLERCINLRQFNLFEDLLNKKDIFSEKTNIKIGHLLYNHEFTTLAISFYENFSIHLDREAFINIIEEFSKQNNIDDALQFAFLALEKGYSNFKIYEWIIKLLEKKSAFDDMEKVLNLAIEQFPDSNYLKDLLIFL